MAGEDHPKVAPAVPEAKLAGIKKRRIIFRSDSLQIWLMECRVEIIVYEVFTSLNIQKKSKDDMPSLSQKLNDGNSNRYVLIQKRLISLKKYSFINLNLPETIASIWNKFGYFVDFLPSCSPNEPKAILVIF